jgi:hypothetical protein
LLVHQNDDELLEILLALRRDHPALGQDRAQVMDPSRAFPDPAVSRLKRGDSWGRPAGLALRRINGATRSAAFN